MHPPRLDVFQSLAYIFDQKQVNSLEFQQKVVVQSGGIDQSDITLAVPGEELLGAGLGLLGQRRRARGETPVALRAPSVSPRSLRSSFIVVFG